MSFMMTDLTVPAHFQLVPERRSTRSSVIVAAGFLRLPAQPASTNLHVMVFWSASNETIVYWSPSLLVMTWPRTNPFSASNASLIVDPVSRNPTFRDVDCVFEGAAAGSLFHSGMRRSAFLHSRWNSRATSTNLVKLARVGALFECTTITIRTCNEFKSFFEVASSIRCP